jgi:hypothetical protein
LPLARHALTDALLAVTPLSSFLTQKAAGRLLPMGSWPDQGMLREFAIHDEVELRGCMASVDKKPRAHPILY